MKRETWRHIAIYILLIGLSAAAMVTATKAVTYMCQLEEETEETTVPETTKDTSLFWTRPNLIDPPKELIVVERLQDTVGAPEATEEPTTEELTTEPETEPEIFTEEATTPPMETETAAASVEKTEEITQAEPVTAQEPAPAEVPLYSCHGLVLDPELQRFAYSLLEGYGMVCYYEYFLCQAYQESTYQADQRTLNHDCWDCGLMQIREIYWPEWSAESGIVGDIMDPYDNVRMACYILSRYWQSTGSIAETISLYMAGWGGPWQEQYVSDVTSHLPFLAKIN